MSDLAKALTDPLKFVRACWPDVELYREQEQVLVSLRDNDETYVPAANQMGKDFVSGLAILWFFLSRHPCRIVTTSAKEDHLRVLWGEIGRFIQTSRLPIDSRHGGALVIHHRELKKIHGGEQCAKSYVKGMVANADRIAAMQGHHIARPMNNAPKTLFVGDECSSVPHEYYRMASTWAHRMLFIGNTWDCSNFWKQHIKGGDVARPSGQGFWRKIIRIRAEDSPNIRKARMQEAAGLVPDGVAVLTGVKGWDEYQKNLKLWDKVQQCVSLEAEFYEGAENLLFPPEWLNRAHYLHAGMGGRKRQAKGIGIDPGEGGANTSMAAVDEFGIIEIVSRKTPNTDEITGDAIAFGRRHGVDPSDWVFDRGGGGKQHADRLRSQGFKVRTVAFGESIQLDPRRGVNQLPERLDQREDRYAYLNRRAEMYGELSLQLDPGYNSRGFAIPPGSAGEAYAQLRQQLAVIPKLYDREGRLRMLPKNKRDPDDTEKTLIELIGHSPDEADAVVLSLHAMLHKPVRAKAGVS